MDGRVVAAMDGADKQRQQCIGQLDDINEWASDSSNEWEEPATVMNAGATGSDSGKWWRQ